MDIQIGLIWLIYSLTSLFFKHANLFWFIYSSYVVQQEFENNSGSSQVFWLLKESELTPSNANILDGWYAVFGYVTKNEDYLADLKVVDVTESIQVVSGLDNLVNPSYKIAG